MASLWSFMAGVDEHTVSSQSYSFSCRHKATWKNLLAMNEDVNLISWYGYLISAEITGVRADSYQNKKEYLLQKIGTAH